jgi:hypothetical protein
MDVVCAEASHNVVVSVGGGRGIYQNIDGDVPQTLLGRMKLESFIPAEMFEESCILRQLINISSACEEEDPLCHRAAVEEEDPPCPRDVGNLTTAACMNVGNLTPTNSLPTDAEDAFFWTDRCQRRRGPRSTEGRLKWMTHRRDYALKTIKSVESGGIWKEMKFIIWHLNI